MLFGILIFFQVVIAVILIFLVMLQGGRGAELGAAFGGMGQSQTMRGTMSGIAKVTYVMGGLFMLFSLTLAYLSSEKAEESVVKGLQAPVSNTEPLEKTPVPSSDDPKALPQKEANTTTEESKTTEESMATEENPAPELEQMDAPPLPTDQKTEN